MNAMFPSSRPNLSVRVIPKIPATMSGAGGIGVSKEDGIWTITPSWGDLLLIAPGILLDPTSKEIWVHDPVTNIYNRMTLAGLGQALFWGTSATPVLIGAGSKTFITQSGKDWLPGMFIQAFSSSVITNFVIGQVTAYSGTSLTINVLAIGGSGTPSDWTIVQSTLPGSGAPGADGVAGGLNYQFVAGLSGDPGSGKVGFDSATIASITSMRISKTDRNGVNIGAELATWDDSTNSAARAKVHVYSPAAQNKFVIGTISGPLVDGGTFITFPLATPVGTTLPDVANAQVSISRTGDKGADGTNGAPGTPGAPGVDGVSTGARYAWNTDISATDPTSGGIKTNQADPSTATLFMISETTALAQNVAAVIASWDDSTTTSNRGSITVQSLVTPSRFLSYRITGNLTDSGPWVTFPVFATAGTPGFTNGEAVQVTFARSGDVGAAGAGSGDMIGANNLSEITNPATARTNIGAASNAYTPSGNIAAVTVPAAIAELDSEKVAKLGDTMTGDLTISKVSPLLALNKAASGQEAAIASKMGGLSRWAFAFGDTAPESGSNAGSDFRLYRFNDAGAYSGSPMTITRANGQATFEAVSGYNEVAITCVPSGFTDWTTNTAPVATLQLTGNTSMTFTVSPVPGRVYTIRIKQDTTPRTVAWSAGYFKFANGITPVITAVAGAVDRFTFIARTDTVLEEIGRAQDIK